MPVNISANSYGKSRVRLVKVERKGDRHEVKDLNINIQLSGAFEASYTDGDNRSVLPTDTMKNTVYALARKQSIGEIEEFGTRLANHFLTTQSSVARATIEIRQQLWDPTTASTFIQGRSELRTARIAGSQTGIEITSGIDNLVVLKTAKSGFVGFVRDAYTTLKETTDRLFGTAIQAEWTCSQRDVAFGVMWRGVRDTTLEIFAEHDSLGVQHTLYAIGEVILERFADIDEIRLAMPNRHCLLVDLSPFGMDNPNEVFLPIDEPHGLISASLRRGV